MYLCENMFQLFEKKNRPNANVSSSMVYTKLYTESLKNI